MDEFGNFTFWETKDKIKIPYNKIKDSHLLNIIIGEFYRQEEEGIALLIEAKKRGLNTEGIEIKETLWDRCGDGCPFD